jgi:hypothetical protein
VYEVVADAHTRAQVDALPVSALAGFAEVRAVLEIAPWSGEPLNAANPEGPVRTMVFGVERRGLLTYLVLEDQRRVDLLDVLWLG